MKVKHSVWHMVQQHSEFQPTAEFEQIFNESFCFKKLEHRLSSLSLRFHWDRTVSDVGCGEDMGEEGCPKARKLSIFLEDKMDGVCDACNSQKRHKLGHQGVAMTMGNNTPVRNQKRF